MAPEIESRRRAGRPRNALLSRERIIEAAFAVVEKRGADFTLAALARRLDVRPSALHHYFATKDEVVAGMRGQLTARIGDHRFSELPWHEAVVPWARAYRATLGAHPGVIAAIATLPVAGEPESIDDYERLAAALRRDGYPDDRIVPVIISLESFIIGSALDAIAPNDNLRPSRDPQRAPTLERAEHAARARAGALGTTVTDDTFEFGLAALIAGIRAANDSPLP